MKALFICIAAGISSFGFVSADKKATDNSIYGVWKGAYGFKEQIEDIMVKFEPGNTMEFYGNGTESEHKIKGTYTLQGDTAIIFSYVINEKHVNIKMKGNLNKTKNFVDGTWQAGEVEKGNFFLQKQSQASAEEQLKSFRYYTR